MTSPPPEPPQGQESEPPDVLLVVIAVAHLLRDVRDRLDDDQRLRALALLAVLGRLREHLEGGDGA